MELYRGTKISGLKYMEPRIVNHGEKYVYATTDKVEAIIYSVKGGNLNYTNIYGYDDDGKRCLIERKKGWLEKIFPVEGRYYGHAWTGYDIIGAGENALNEEEMVYVTEHGEAYHRNINCSHLRLSVKSTSLSGIDKLRNKDRSKYYPCEYCAGNIAAGDVFITDYGNRYHGRVDCAGLKRTIYTIPISEVGARHPCKDCG